MDLLKILFANKKFRLGLLLVFILVIVWLVFSYVSKGQLEITTNDETSQIKIYKPEDEGEKVLATGIGTLKMRIKAGTYKVIVSNRATSTQKIKKVAILKKTQDRIELRAPASPEPVLPGAVFGVNPTKNNLLYIDDATRVLYKIDSSGLPKIIDPNHTYQDFEWADQNFGVGKTEENTVVLYQDGFVRPLALPEPVGNNKVSVSLTKNRKLYLSIGANVWQSDAGKNFQKIYTAKSATVRVVAGTKYLALIVYSDGEQEPDAIILENGQVKLEKEFGVYELAWSPDGNFLAVVGDEDSGIYDANLDQTHSLYGKNVGGISWFDDNTLIYSKAGALWQYKQDVSESTILATTPSLGAISSIYPSASQNYIYFNATRASNSSEYTFFRAGLDELTQNVPDYLFGLSTFFPSTTTDGCGFSYTNYINPAIVSNSPASDDICRDALLNELKADRLPIGSFELLYNQVQTSND
jgi:hypothetical protein